MSDLIDRQKAIEALRRAEALTLAFGYHNIIDTIRELPTIEERKTGEWIDFSMSIKGVPTEACGVCGEWSYGMGKNFCPNCGAKNMRGGNT